VTYVAGRGSEDVTGSLLHLALASLLFVGSHVVLSSGAVRPPLVAVIGEPLFRGLYSILALALIVWMVMAYNAAPFVDIWDPATGWRHLSLTLMVPAAILVIGGITTPSPTAAGTDTRDMAARGPKGIAKITRHPMMWGIGLWGISHLLANGDAAGMLLFGSLTALALLGPLAIDARRRASMGADWERFAAETSYLPFAAMAAGRTRLRFREVGWWRLGLGIALYVVLLGAHPWLFGVNPLPF
jgi:uncharacterized membrane protein